MSLPKQSYIIACTPRSGSHLLADGLDLTGIAGHPQERFPRPWQGAAVTASERDALVTASPPESSYDGVLDAEYVKKAIELGMTGNGVFGLNMHWFQLNDAVRRIRSFLGNSTSSSHEALSLAFPNLSYIWLGRRDKVAQAVSWHKAIQTGRYVKLKESNYPVEQTVKAEFDFVKIKSYFSALRSSDNGWAHYFEKNNLNPIHIYYEDLCANFSETIFAALGYLKLDCIGITVGEPRHEKVANEESSEWVRRFNMIYETSRGAGRKA